MAKDIRPISCPNCGGTVEGSKCPYCGSVFWDVADLEIGKPAWLQFKHNDRIFICKVIPERISITHKCEPTYFYADNIKVVPVAAEPSMDISLDFFTVPYGKTRKEYSRSVDVDSPVRDEYLDNMEEE